MRQPGLPLEDMPQPAHVPAPEVNQQYREAEQKLDNLRYLSTRSSTPPSQADEQSLLIDQRRFNVPPNGNPDLFEKAS